MGISRDTGESLHRLHSTHGISALAFQLHWQNGKAAPWHHDKVAGIVLVASCRWICDAQSLLLYCTVLYSCHCGQSSAWVGTYVRYSGYSTCRSSWRAKVVMLTPLPTYHSQLVQTVRPHPYAMHAGFISTSTCLVDYGADLTPAERACSPRPPASSDVTHGC